MYRKILVVIGGLCCLFWGIAHLFPLNAIVKGFGNISIDNIYIIRMEWINEGFTLIFIGVLIILATILSKEKNYTLKIVYAVSAVMLFSMAILSIFTGNNINFLPFKICVYIFSVSGILILQGVLK